METCPDICIHSFRPCGRNNSLLQLPISSPRCISRSGSWKFSFPKQGQNKNFVPCYQDNNRDWAGQHLGKTHPTSYSTGASEKIWHQSSWFWEQKMCFHSFLADLQESVNWTAGAFGTMLQCITCVWFQKCKIWSQFNQILFVTNLRWRTRYWTHCH